MATYRRAIANCLILLSLASLASGAHASGQDGPQDYYVSRERPDVDLDLYQSGKLGVVQLGYPRIFLYPAWRAIMLGRDPLDSEKRKAGALDKLCCDRKGWIDERDPSHPKAKWATMRASITAQVPNVRLTTETYDEKNSYRYYTSCTDESYRFAEATLAQLKQRADATPELLKEWVAGQDAVYEFCGRTKTMVGSGEPSNSLVLLQVPPSVIPPQLPASRPKIWQQYRDYQAASALFYAGEHKKASTAFESISQQDGHPLQKWGAYLALRAKIREIYLTRKKNNPEPQNQSLSFTNDGIEIFSVDFDEASVAEIASATEKITRNPQFKEVHELARASLRAFRYRVTPHQQFAALSEQLSRYQQDPTVDDVLGDWRRLANYFFDSYISQDANYMQSVTARQQWIDALRAKYSYFDWMFTVQSCAAEAVLENPNTCKKEAAHALAQWSKAKADNKEAQARTWFTAVLMTAHESNNEIEAQAARIHDTAPEYLSVQYNLARLLRLSGGRDQARTLLNITLKKPVESGSALNLLLQERFASANSLEDASAFLYRGQLGYLNPDTKETALVSQSSGRIADTADWLNQGLSVKDLLRLADIKTLPTNLRSELATMAWLRADLLGKNELADRAVAKLATLAPSRATPSNRYLRAPTALLRRHAVAIAMLNFGLSTRIIREFDAGDIYWRKGENKVHPYSPEEEPAAPQLSSEAAIRDAEIAKLASVPLGNTFIASHLLTYAAVHPKDPEIPELLARSIQSNKYSYACSEDNKDCKKPFRLCFELLHKKYGTTKWASETKYWY